MKGKRKTIFLINLGKQKLYEFSEREKDLKEKVFFQNFISK